MTLTTKIDRRAILSADPKSFNELLDFFEDYAAGLFAPLEKACDLIREQFDYLGGDIFGHICDVSHNSQELVEQLKEIRAKHNMGRTITLCLDLGDARVARYALGEVASIIDDAEAAFGAVQRALDMDDLSEKPEMRAFVSMAQRALISAVEREVPQLRKLANTLHYEMAKKPEQQEEAA